MLQKIKKGGFTLIELLVVIAIIAILATLVLVALEGAQDQAEDVDKQGAISQIRSLGQLTYSEDGHYSGLEDRDEFPDQEIHGDQITVEYDVADPDNEDAEHFIAYIQNSEGNYFCTDDSLDIGEVDFDEITDSDWTEVDAEDGCPQFVEDIE